MKKILLILSIMVFAFSSYVFAESDLLIKVEEKLANPGETVTLNVDIEENPGILALLFDITYDRERLELFSSEDKGLLSGAMFGETTAQYPYTCLYNSASSTDNKEKGTLFSLTFKVKEEAKPGRAFVSLDYASGNIYNVKLDEVTPIITDGGIIILGDSEEENKPQTGAQSTIAGGSSSGDGETRYTVKFDADGGSNVVSKTAVRNSKVAEPTAPTKDGYTFNGWYTDEELTVPYDFETKVTKNFTLYAKWEKIDDETDKPDTSGYDCPSLGFGDLDVKAWYHLDTDYVIENGIFKGVTETEFAPNDKLTRAMLVTVLYRVEGEPVINRSIPFADANMGAYYANAVIWAKQNSIVNGISETEFAPNDNITREQIAAIMHRYAQYKGIDVSVGENTNILSYDDFAQISEYAVSAMQWAVGGGLIKGKSESTLGPLDNATRVEVAAILHRYIEANK